jgi:transcriptional enhancer factor
MEMAIRVPVLPSSSSSSQCYSPTTIPDFTSNRHVNSRNSSSSSDSHPRQPLSKATGNIQHSSSLVRSSYPQPPSLSIPPTLGSTYGTGPAPAYFTRYQQQQQRYQFHRHQQHHGPGRGVQRPQGNINPIWLSTQFQTYRKKQADKDDKSDQKWPDVLEEAFLDGTLPPTFFLLIVFVE